MTFDSTIIAFCDRFLSQRTFDLVVAPALADCEFEDAAGRRSRAANRIAVIRAVAGGWLHDASGQTADFAKLTLLSMSYFVVPVAMGSSIFSTWSAFFAAVFTVMLLSMAPVIICFWPTRPLTRRTE
jgi:hypothetical protein